LGKVEPKGGLKTILFFHLWERWSQKVD